MAIQTKIVLYGNKHQVKSTQLSKAKSFHLYVKQTDGSFSRVTDERVVFPPALKVADKKIFIEAFLESLFKKKVRAKKQQGVKTRVTKEVEAITSHIQPQGYRVGYLLYDSKGRIVKTLSRATAFNIVINGITVSDEPIEFYQSRLRVNEKMDYIDSFILSFFPEYEPESLARKTADKLTNSERAKLVRKKKPKLGDIVLGYPPLDPPRIVDRKERAIIRGQARLKLKEEFNIDGVEAETIIKALFSAFKKNLPLIPKLMEEFMVVYYLNQKDKRSHVSRLLRGKEISANIAERTWLKGELSQIDTVLKLSLIKVEKEISRIHPETKEEFEELVITDHLFAKVVATYRGNMEMSAEDLQGGQWRDTVFDTVITDIMNVFQGFVDNGVFEYSNRPEYIIRIVCPLFDKDYGITDGLKTPSKNKRFGFGISLDRTNFSSLEDVRRHLLRPNTQNLRTTEIDKISLFDRVKHRLREYLRLNRLNTFSITGFTIERLIMD